MSLLQRIDAATSLLAARSTAQNSAAQRDALVNLVQTDRATPGEIVHAAGRVPMMNWYSKEDMLTVQNALIGCSPRGGAWRPQDFGGFVSMLPDWVWDDLTNKSKDLNQKGAPCANFSA